MACLLCACICLGILIIYCDIDCLVGGLLVWLFDLLDVGFCVVVGYCLGGFRGCCSLLLLCFRWLCAFLWVVDCRLLCWVLCPGSLRFAIHFTLSYYFAFTWILSVRLVVFAFGS